MMLTPQLTICFVVVAAGSALVSAFSPPPHKIPITFRIHSNALLPLLQSKHASDEDNQEDEQLFFDDFGDGFVGSASADEPLDSANDDSSFLSSLTERIQQTRTEEVRKDAKLAKNWKTGNWGVRGFILDKTDPLREAVADTTTSGTAASSGDQGLASSTPRLGGSGSETPSANAAQGNVSPIHVSKIVADQSHSLNSIPDIICVGRTDGTVLLVKIGTQYLTKFTAVPKLRVDDSSSWDPSEGIGKESGADTNADTASENGPSVRVETELVRDEVVQDELQDETDDGTQNAPDYPMEDPFDELYGGGGVDANRVEKSQEVTDQGTPFEVLYQFRAYEADQEISSLLFIDNTVFASGGDSPDIRSWMIPEEDSDKDDASVKMLPGKTLSGAHSDKIVALKTLSSHGDIEDPDLLLSASRDGSFALWELKSGDLVFRCQMLDDSSEAVSITCADIDMSGGNGNVIYFGLGTGHVVGYFVTDVIGSASAGGVCPIPSCRFQAHDGEGGVTAILAAGEGTSASNSMQQAQLTSILLTGGADGHVKQWEMLPRKLGGESQESDMSSPTFKVEHWPRLSTQRMKRRAHLFKGHAGCQVTAIAQVDSSKFLSAGTDGTVRVWSPSKGDEMYKLDGFDCSLDCLVLASDSLITNGMENMVCVHDFDVEIDESDGYDLEW